MEIFLNLLSYFGIDLLTEQATFTDLIQFMMLSFLAMFLVLFIFKLFFAAVWQIQNRLRW